MKIGHWGEASGAVGPTKGVSHWTDDSLISSAAATVSRSRFAGLWERWDGAETSRWRRSRSSWLSRTNCCYDRDGNLTESEDAEGQRTRFEYDAFGRRTKVIDSEAGTWEYAYDAEGRLLEETDANGHTVSYTHNELGQQTQIATTDTQLEYDYDDLGRLETVTRNEATPEITTYVYDLVGNQVRVEHANGMFSHYGYDERNILTRLTHEKLVDDQPVELARFDYALNVDGSRRGVEQVLDKDFVSESDDLVTQIDWTYDAANRLTQEQFSATHDPSIDWSR